MVYNCSQRFTSPIKEIKDTLFCGMWTVVNRCELLWSVVNHCKLLWIIAKPPQGIYSEYILKDRSRKSSFYGWQLFPRRVALSAIACVMPDFCCWVQSLGLLSAKSLRWILWIKIYTDITLGLYFAILYYKHDLLFSNVCGLNLCLARPLTIAACQSGRQCTETGNESAENYSSLLLSLQILT